MRMFVHGYQILEASYLEHLRTLKRLGRKNEHGK
jgi:hypothetical protein